MIVALAYLAVGIAFTVGCAWYLRRERRHNPNECHCWMCEQGRQRHQRQAIEESERIGWRRG